MSTEPTLTQTHVPVGGVPDHPAGRLVALWLTQGATPLGLSILADASQEANSHGPDCSQVRTTLLVVAYDEDGGTSYLAISPASTGPGCALNAMLHDNRLEGVRVAAMVSEEPYSDEGGER